MSRRESTELVLVSRIASVMRGKLAANRHRGSWLDIGLPELQSMLREEMIELLVAVSAKKKVSDVWQEAADIACIAAMIADAYEAVEVSGDES